LSTTLALFPYTTLFRSYAIEDYVVSRYQMYVQVYFHPVSRSFEVLLQHLLERAKFVFDEGQKDSRVNTDFISPTLQPLFAGNLTLQQYVRLDDSLMLANISAWRYAEDAILADLAIRFIDRKPLTSIVMTAESTKLFPTIKQLINWAGFDTRYSTAENDSFDLPSDAYKPRDKKPRTQSEL